MNKHIEEKIKEFEKKYVRYTDAGVFVSYINSKGVEIDEWLTETLKEIAEKSREEGYQMALEMLKLEYLSIQI